MQQMRAQVAAEAPLEACGLLAGAEGRVLKVYALENELRSPTRFRIAPQEQLAAFMEIEEAGWELLAIYHSHPGGPPHPSTSDIAEALYPEALHLIWDGSGPDWQARAFRIQGNEYHEIPLNVEEAATSA